MITFTSLVERYGKNGEKSGWTFVTVSAETSNQIKPSFKKSYRVKGTLNNLEIEGVSLVPIGDGVYILPLNAELRKKLKVNLGDTVILCLTEDTAEQTVDEDFLACLHDDPEAEQNFLALPKSHQMYYSRWICSAKTEATKTKRIAQAVFGLSRKLSFAETLKAKVW